MRVGGDSGVVMMAAAAEDGGGGQRQRRQTTTARTTTACEIGRRTTKGMDKSGRRETAETWSGDDGCGGKRWRQWTKTAADDDDGNGRRRQWRTPKAADDNSKRDRVADYKGEGGERAANNSGIRQKADKPAGQRA